MSDLTAEDAKLVTLARTAKVRTRAAEGAAVRDLDGRTYAAASIGLPSLRLTALEVCVAMAISSGATGLEAAVVLAEVGVVDEIDLLALGDFAGEGIPVFIGDATGIIHTRARTHSADERTT